MRRAGGVTWGLWPEPPPVYDGPVRAVTRGPLTIKGVTREVELPIRILGVKDIPAEMQDSILFSDRSYTFFNPEKGLVKGAAEVPSPPAAAWLSTKRPRLFKAMLTVAVLLPPALVRVTVRSRIPGNVAIERCSFGA